MIFFSWSTMDTVSVFVLPWGSPWLTYSWPFGMWQASQACGQFSVHTSHQKCEKTPGPSLCDVSGKSRSTCSHLVSNFKPHLVSCFYISGVKYLAELRRGRGSSFQFRTYSLAWQGRHGVWGASLVSAGSRSHGVTQFGCWGNRMEPKEGPGCNSQDPLQMTHVGQLVLTSQRPHKFPNSASSQDQSHEPLGDISDSNHTCLLTPVILNRRLCQFWPLGPQHGKSTRFKLFSWNLRFMYSGDSPWNILQKAALYKTQYKEHWHYMVRDGGPWRSAEYTALEKGRMKTP